jgi:hypothetical protein
LETLDEFRRSQDISGYADRLMDLVEEISNHGMTYFFLHPVEMVGMNSVAQKTIGVTINSGKKAVLSVSRQLARRLDEQQLRDIADFLEGLLVEVADDEVDQ